MAHFMDYTKHSECIVNHEKIICMTCDKEKKIYLKPVSHTSVLVNIGNTVRLFERIADDIALILLIGSNALRITVKIQPEYQRFSLARTKLWGNSGKKMF